MSDLITQIAVIETQMKNIAKQVDDGFLNNSKEHREIMQFVQNAMDKKAGKWVETVLVGIGYIVGVAVIGALLSLILIN